MTPLAIIAGNGELPRRLAEARAAAGLPYLLIVFAGCMQDWMEGHPLQHHRFEKAGRLFRGLAEVGAKHIVFAGGMNRPTLKPWTADLTAARLLLRAVRLLRKGDDAMLRGFAGFFEARGVTLISPAEVLGDALTVPVGALGSVPLSAQNRADAGRAAKIVAAMGVLDIGQGAVVANGLCLGVEAIEGTDLMLERLADLPAERRAACPPPSGVLFKGPKPGQDRRMDMPTIGPDTVRRAAKGGLSAIVVAAGETALMDPDGTRTAADQAKLAVYGATPEELSAWASIPDV